MVVAGVLLLFVLMATRKLSNMRLYPKTGLQEMFFSGEQKKRQQYFTNTRKSLFLPVSVFLSKESEDA